MSFDTPKSIPSSQFSAIYHLLSLIIICSLIAAAFTPAVAAPTDDFNSPTPISPSGGQVYTATGENGTMAAPPVALPAFSWSEVTGATRYRFQISQDISFSTKLEFVTPLTRWTPTSANQFNDGLWYWRVKVDNPSPGSAYSSIQSFHREWASANNNPALILPADGSLLEFLDSSTFQWSPVLGAARYRFQISTNSIFTALVYNQVTLATVHQPINKLADGTFYWRVIPLDPANREGTPSEVRNFTQQYNQIPTLLEPNNGSFPTFTPTFHWTAVRGAQFYRLQYSTDPSFNSGITQVDTRNTQYTPTATLPNDVNYYWRVRTISGQSQSNWSEVWSFQKRWYLQATLLTPTNLFQLARFPFFSWTPVPGAATYKIEYNTSNSFPPGPGGETATTANPFYSFQNYKGDYGPRYWRVTPIDANNHPGLPSSVSSYVSYQDYTAPQLIYPIYYYPPNPLHQPHEDRSVPQPVFQWQRVLDSSGLIFAPAYRVQVSASPTFTPLVWTVDTENLSAAPTIANNFTPDPNLEYYWRVCPLDSLGGSCLLASGSNPWWSQPWKTRIDSSLMPAATSGSAPELLRPRDLYEFGEITPLLEWLPFQGADSYDVQISRYSNFSVILDSAVVSYTAFAPTTSFAQRSLARNDFGTFYWRVRARSGVIPLGSWSQARRFLIAAHSQWMDSRSIGSISNRLQIASDAPGDVLSNFDLTSLYAAQDSDYWYVGFNAYTSTTVDMKYVLYFDLDHTENSGATSDAQGYTVSTSPAFQPEYAIYIPQINGNFSASSVVMYQWVNPSWVFLAVLSTTAGDLYYEPSSNYVELKVENTAIGMGQDTGSYALALFSVPSGSGSPQDSVPTSPGIPGSTVLTHFASVTERLTAVQPSDHTSNDPQTFSSVPPLFWNYSEVAPWTGANLKVYLDDQFTTEVGDFKLTSNAYYYSDNARPWPTDLSGDNTYYWRVRPRYLLGSNSLFGAWSEGNSFVRNGLIPTNLQESVTFATPTFSWDMAEGASGYDVQVDNDPNFGSPVFTQVTTQNEYTWTTTLPNGIYYWRVRMRRNGNVINEWSPPKMFNLSYPIPSGLTPNDPNALSVVGRAPTMCWTPLIASQNSTPTLAAYKYRLQVSFGDPTFSSIYESIDTEQACYTPSKGYLDGKYYWRVAMIDGNSNLGAYSPAAEFTKQYPMANLLNPLSGAEVTTTPTFQWTVVNGAARYRLEISKFSTFSPLYDSVTTNLAEFTPTKVYDNNQTYHWRVAIIDADGRYGPFNNEVVILDPLSGKNKLFLPFVNK